MVVEVNVRRAERGRPLDVAYLSRLSADAAPALAATLARVEPEARATLERALATRWRPDAPGASFRADPRGWNLARARAAAAVRALSQSP